MADEPEVPEWIDEPTLAVHSPQHLVVANLVDGAVCSGRHRPFNESVRVVDEHLDPYRSAAERGRCIPPVVLLLHAKAEWVSRRISVHLEEGVFFFNGIGQDAGTELDRSRRGPLQIGHGEIKVDLLWLPVRPLGGHELRDTLKSQLKGQSVKVNFAPRRVGRVDNSTEQVTVEGGESRRIWTIKDK